MTPRAVTSRGFLQRRSNFSGVVLDLVSVQQIPHLYITHDYDPLQGLCNNEDEANVGTQFDICGLKIAPMNTNFNCIAVGTFPIANDEISGPFYDVAKILSVEMNFVPRIRYCIGEGYFIHSIC